ncbi:MAG: flagellar motor switch protein FliG [Rubinisphaera brasiliensis]|uniref:Flagellar motor switch protein FliG n=1 Tax=Rubinisphaera brasiliensis (strain ATCC 49424 / DSM 5305 / JCM 21570 / IAM 15109 / NBRC 103401 / IFAM 1448) TaxID=756272 RepID=F0SNY3_RUBBR|nr:MULTISPECIES: flagellar motor switch protein FliG [Rubinisphaera]ADY60059.1 flagellar motor switch protein FliG [Rubinisphaera brasiliensis DSM 5305]MBR9803101.1 flagellar motor switch protein FliG [bacterium]
MDAIRKSAILLLSLDKPLAKEVIGQMPRDVVEKVTLEIARLKNVSRAEQEKVLDEFYSAARERTPMERGGLDTVDDLLRDSLGDDAQSILDNVKHSMSSVPFGFLHKVGADNLLTFIVEEHPQTIALVMSHLPAAQAAEVLSGLPANKQLEVIRRVAHMEQTNPEVVEDVEKSLESRMLSTINQQLEKAGGVPIVAEILNLTDRMTNRGILENLEEDDSELADEIRRLMFVFDDLLKLDNKAIQSLLKEVDNSQWAMALKGASEEIRDKILSNLSARAADMLREEMEFLGAVRLSDVEMMQSQIVDAVRRLEDAGEIVVSSGSETEQFVS